MLRERGVPSHASFRRLSNPRDLRGLGYDDSEGETKTFYVFRGFTPYGDMCRPLTQFREAPSFGLRCPLCGKPSVPMAVHAVGLKCLGDIVSALYSLVRKRSCFLLNFGTLEESTEWVRRFLPLGLLHKSDQLLRNLIHRTD